MNVRICARRGCERQVWKDNLAYCSSVCHFTVSQIDSAEVAARKNGDIDVAHKWFAVAVTLNDTLNEINEYKMAYYNAIGKGMNSGKSETRQ